MLGEVKVWYMTEEERLAYIKKHPIKQTEKPKGSGIFTFENVDYDRKRENAQKARAAKDYKWRSQKATEASKEAREK